MSIEQKLSNKLQNFSILDIGLVKWVYMLIGVLVATTYTELLFISFVFYLVLSLIATMPIVLHIFSFKGLYIEKCRSYAKSNNPAFQILLFLSCFFFGCMLATLIPVLSNVDWWWYLLLIVILAIKPMKSNLFW